MNGGYRFRFDRDRFQRVDNFPMNRPVATVGGCGVIVMLINIALTVALMGALWWCYNHIVAPSSGLPIMTVHS
jgi:hypothetical protein